MENLVKMIKLAEKSNLMFINLNMESVAFWIIYKVSFLKKNTFRNERELVLP